MEHESQHELRTILDSCTNQKYLYSTPSANESLKILFKNASKQNTGLPGFPDMIYYDETILVIFECKSKKATNYTLTKALDDIKFYTQHIDYSLCSTLKIYGCAFIDKSLYSLYDVNTQTNELTINKNTLEIFFNVHNSKNYTLINKLDIYKMDNDIHEVHNYIRNNTKISNEDKSLFIGGILIALLDESFVSLLKNTDLVVNKDISTCISFMLKKHNIDIDEIYNSLNNQHLLFLTNEILHIWSSNKSIDILNKFYSEFVRYQNTDSKSLGIVLTPHHIVKLMIKLLNISSNDVVLDICAGTGSFLCEAAKYKPKQLIACEYQNKLFNLLKINSVLRDGQISCVHNNCFNEQFTATKSVINPPYGMKDNNELHFILKQLNSVVENGLVCALIPSSCLSSSKYYKYRNELLTHGKILKIIKCNEKLFYPTANIAVSIILIQKNKLGHILDADLVEFIDYSDDGIMCKKHNGKVKTNDFKTKFNLIFTNNHTKLLIDKTADWVVNNTSQCFVTERDLKIHALNIEYKNKLDLINTTELYNTPISYKYNKYVKVDELFTIQTCKRVTMSEVECNTGSYPYIASSKKNNGIVGYINKYTHDGNCLTIANSGSVGYCFYQECAFCGTDSIYILTLKPGNKYYDIMTPEIGLILSLILTKRFTNGDFNFSRALRTNRLKHEQIFI